MQVSDRCVAVLDVLGFRERVRKGQLEQLADALDQLARYVHDAEFTWSFGLVGQDVQLQSGREKIYRLLFSDSLFLWSGSIPSTHIRRYARIGGFVRHVGAIIGEGLLNGVPLRAGVAFGPVLIDLKKQIIIGQPIVDAHLVESMQEWIGGAIHSSFPDDSRADEAQYPVPVKHTAGGRLERAIDWVEPAYHGTRQAPDTRLDRFEEVLRRGARDAATDAVRQKYTNSLAFLADRRAYLRQGHLRRA